MKKRQFLAAGLLGMSTTAIAANKKAPVACSAPKDSGPVLLTLTGAIGAGNRGALDPALEGQTRAVEKRYKEMGGKITVIIQDGVGHYPLSPRDPAPVVEAIAGSAP